MCNYLTEMKEYVPAVKIISSMAMLKSIKYCSLPLFREK